MSATPSITGGATLSSAGNPSAAASGRSRAQLNTAVLLSLVAAAIHLAVAPEHFREFTVYGVFFVAVAFAQVALAIGLLARPGRRLFLVGALGTLAVVALWVTSRSVGLPIAPQPWVPEPVGFTDVIATIVEIVAVIVLLALIRVPRRPRQRSLFRVTLHTVPGALLAALAGFLGVAAALSPMEMSHSAAPALPGVRDTSLTTLVAAPGPEPVREFTLTAAPLAPGGQAAWAFNGSVPGPELRVSQGDRVRVTLVNHLPQPTSVHWHGLRLPNAADGVAGLTQDAVKPGASFTYEFVATDPGTYWYHSHQDPLDQVVRGLLGALVVTPRQGAAPAARDLSLLVHNRRDGIAVNGSTNLHLDAAPGDSVRLRLINGVSPDFSGTPLRPYLVGVPYVVSALDGHDLHEPGQLGPERILLGMGQRADLVFTMPVTGSVSLAGLAMPAPLPFFKPATAAVTIGSGSAPALPDEKSLPTFDLTTYGTAAPESLRLDTAFEVSRRLLLGGGAYFRDGGFAFNDTFNGAASPDAPPLEVHTGDRVLLHIVNPTGKFHPIHIHGHVVTVLAKNGQPLTGSPVHVDAILLAPGETWDVAFLADNPGIWMLHCHVLEHAAAGMSMTINYAGIYTPFSMGRQSGNTPE